MARDLVSVDPSQKLSLAQWQRYEQVGLAPELDLDELVLDWTNSGIGDLDAKGALTALNLDRTIEGGSTVTMTLKDPDLQLWAGGRSVDRVRGLSSAQRTALRKHPVEVDEGWEPLLGPDTVGRAVEVELDGVTFRLVKVRYSTTTGEAELTFEDRVVYWLKRKRGERHVDRATCTRAQFILSLLREIKARRYRFVCPELNVRQPIDASASTTRRHLLAVNALTAGATAAAAADPATRGGFSSGASFTIKGARATPDQKRNLDGVLTECAAQGASGDVMVATVCCVIQESVAKRLGYGDAAGPDSRGLFQQRSPWGSMDARLDPRRSTRMFLTGGAGGQPGWKQKNDPKLQRVPGGIESAVTRVQVSVGGYVQHQSEAKRIVSAWGGASTEGSAAGGGTYTKSYQFSRNSDEDSWTAIQRLAGEIGWRCFVVGNSVYYMSEQALYARRARYEVTPEDPAVLELAYDVDWGKPTSELTLTVALDRWGAPPGSVIVVDGFGPPDGRWLVSSVSRDYFAPTAEVTCVQPGKAKLEPANEQATRASNAVGADSSATEVDNGTIAGRVYNAAASISAKNLPYTWGGGHAHCGTPDGGTGRDPGPGYDCSGSVCAVLAAAGLGYRPGGPADTSGTIAASWGQPGEGRQFTVWANSGHVWMQLHVGHAWRFDTSPYGSGPRGPHLRTTPRPTAGFTPRHWPGC
jgi:hypothetical protein